ncbi:MAG: C45 family peptidase [Nocardioidaceae bacterium]
MFPVITVTGAAYERGRQYGEQARGRVHRSVEAYARVFQHYAGWDWQRATSEAKQFLTAIEAFAPQLVDELAGIADGASLALEDVLAINVRTEILYAARVRNALALPAPAECTAFASVAPDRHVVAGQNWDWIPFSADTVVALQQRPDDGPAFVTVVEAGLLAKFGVNSSGLAVMTNALACTEDVGEAAVPYHVVLRALLGCRTTEEAVERVQSAPRASSANYLVADESGHAVNVEARPGDAHNLHRIEPDEHGVLLHTNHFVSPDFDSVDYADLVPSTSETRLTRVADQVVQMDDPTELSVFDAVLTDHMHQPDTVCRHPDLDLPALEQTMTVASVLMDLTARQLRVSEGPPCERGYEELDWPSV